MVNSLKSSSESGLFLQTVFLLLILVLGMCK